MFRFRVISSILMYFCVFTMMCEPVPVFAADGPSMKDVLPIHECSNGWIMEDNVKIFTRDTLFDHINGEAELYFPYGFDLLATAIYTNKANPQSAILADVYRMGSLLDAFGIYSNYRKANSERASTGAEGFISPTQLMFYQDRYFIRLQASGATNMDKNTLLECGRAISRNLPPNKDCPKEVEIFNMSGVVPKSERYIAQSLLGYAYFRRGIIAEAILEGKRPQIFMVSEDSRDEARKVFDQYLLYLKASGQAIQLTETSEWIFMTAADPLYGNVVVEHSGRYVIGAVRVKDVSSAIKLLEQLRSRLVSYDNVYKP